MRTFAVRIVKFARTLPGDGPAQAIARQVAKAGTGVSANFARFCSRL
jgi:hypothetical protein